MSDASMDYEHKEEPPRIAVPPNLNWLVLPCGCSVDVNHNHNSGSSSAEGTKPDTTGPCPAVPCWVAQEGGATSWRPYPSSRTG